MEQAEQKNIRLVVNDEQTLYTPYSPEAEFNESLKIYIREKIARIDYRQGVSLTVVSREPINEEKFRSAVANWITDEKALFRKKDKRINRLLITMLVLGSIFVILSVNLVKRFYVVRYALLPIMGSLALSKAASMLIFDMPSSRAKKQILTQMEKNNAITFERENHCQEN